MEGVGWGKPIPTMPRLEDMTMKKTGLLWLGAAAVVIAGAILCWTIFFSGFPARGSRLRKAQLKIV